jgi:hypothetical protein
MGHFRFRKRIKLFPGLWLNASKRGISASIGGRGATVNISKKGVRETVSVPGTGISYQTKRVGLSRPHGPAKAPRQSVSPASMLAFVLVAAAVLWILAHWH